MQPHRLENSKTLVTLSGSFNCSGVAIMRDIGLSGFNKNRRLDQHKALIFDAPSCQYDIIFGADFLQKAGFSFLYETYEMECLGVNSDALVPRDAAK